MKLIALLTGFVAMSVAAFSQDSGWIELFNGSNLNGWKKLNGTAEYKIEDGAIVGYAKLNTPNTFLATEQRYSDFILELDVLLDSDLNSGVQFRSASDPAFKNGRVHGYQVEIDPSARAFSGGIYDEARRGWLYPLSRNPEAQNAFRMGQWNRFRIQAIGPEITTWINGVMCSYLADTVSGSGFIALQVHSIDDPAQAGNTVRWKNIRIKTKNIDDDRWAPDPQTPQISYLVNQLTEWEKRRGWRLLWDGQTTTGWRGAKLDHFPESGWEIGDGVLTITSSGGGEAEGPGDIVTENLFSDFMLELEFRISEGANSGIKYFVDADLNRGEGSAIGCEFQILDDEKHPDAKQGVRGNRTVGALYDLIAPENLSVPGRGKQFKGVGEWNKALIVSRDGKVEHWLNNEKTVEYDRFSQMFRALVNYSKYKDWEGFGRWPEGNILLQDHGDEVSFRSIKVKEF